MNIITSTPKDPQHDAIFSLETLIEFLKFPQTRPFGVLIYQNPAENFPPNSTPKRPIFGDKAEMKLLPRNAILDDPRVCVWALGKYSERHKRTPHTFSTLHFPGENPTAGKTQHSNNRTKSLHSALENPKWKSILERNEKSRNKKLQDSTRKKQISNCANTSIYNKQIARGLGGGALFT